jgi:hypothetical protein
VSGEGSLSDKARIVYVSFSLLVDRWHMKQFTAVIVTLSLAVIAGCAAKEVLIPKSAISAGNDLTGHWQLREDSETAAKRIRDAEFAAAGGHEPLVPRGNHSSARSARRDSGGASVHVFLESGRSLKVTQTDYGLFISFDRAVVEEYRFGENREVSVGPINADRVSGWEGSSYVIETLDEDDAKLIEAYQLQDGGRSLQRKITIINKKATQLAIEQMFDRISVSH